MRVLILLYLVSIAVASAKHYKLFVLTGQSNSLGTTAGGEADPTSESEPADDHVLFFWDNVADASNSIGDSGGAWTTLQDQQGGFYPGSARHWGPEINFARTLYRAGVRDFGLIKASRGGGGNSNWSKSGSGQMYGHVKDTVDAATALLTANGDTFEIIGFLYVQGESDSGGEAVIADARLSELVANLRTDITNASAMHAVVGGIAAAGGNRNTVRAKQAGLAAGDPMISYFENLDLQGQLYDGLHFDKAAKLTIGKRFAQKFFEAEVVTPNYGKLVFMGDSIVQGGLGYPSFRYALFKHLVDASANYTFTGSVTGAYQNNAGATPDYEGEVFVNVNEGHFGWRAFWENGRVPLPSNRRSGNRGEGTILNWTGQAAQYELSSSGNFVAYPDPGASGSGNTGTIYVPDSVVIMIGINDLADGGTPAQLRDDVSTMIDQIRAANANVSIFLNYLLHTDQTAVLQVNVDTFNRLLQPLADTKNGGSATSAVWVIDASTGFDPVVLTHDEVHPNTTGEIFVARRIAEGLGLSPKELVEVETIFPVTERKDLTVCFLGNAIYNGAEFINGWSEISAAATTESLVGTIFNRTHINGAGEWLEGIASSKDGGTTTWNTGNDGDWTFEIKMKFQANPSGFSIWLGTGTQRIIVDVFGDRTQDNGSGDFNVAHNNLDGEFHQWRVVHDSSASKYHVWRDGVRLTPTAGASYDSAGADSRIVLGDRTGGSFGNNYSVDIASICYDQSDGYLPLGADVDGDGMSDAFEIEYFGNLTAALPGEDGDGDRNRNLEEYLADTDPTDPVSFISTRAIVEAAGRAQVVLKESSVRRNYELYQSDDLGIADPWMLIDGPMLGNGGDLTLTGEALTGPRSFYRVSVSLP